MATASPPLTNLVRLVAETGALASWSDADLLARFAAARLDPDDGGSLAFEVLVRRHGPLVWSVCRRALGDATDADDAFQATLLVLVRRAGAIRVGDSLAPWLFGVARRVAQRARLDRERRRSREGSNLGAIAEPVMPDGAAPQLADAVVALHAEVARLPEPFRSALIRCDLGGESIEAAARATNCPPGTVKSRLHRARLRLKRGLARRGFGSFDPQAAALGGLIGPPDRLVTTVVAQIARTASSGAIPPWFLGFPLLKGASRMIALIPVRWVAAATLSTALGALGLATLGQKPNVVPGASQASAEPARPTASPRPPATEGNKVPMADYVVEPPDILSVEVLEALPGRNITGEHLVRPDGKISLGFYGEVYVAGLTLTETKAKIVMHLRKYLTDACLGLQLVDAEGKETQVKPADTDRVFVEVATFNSKVYYVQGAVATPGRLPVTGNETVLDAIHFAGNLLFADSGRAEVTLIRPAIGIRELQKLPVDLKAIEQGDTRTNYQLMPGDRVVVARNPPLTDEDLGNARLLQKVQEQGTRLDALEKKLDRILEKLNTPASVPPTPTVPQPSQ